MNVQYLLPNITQQQKGSRNSFKTYVSVKKPDRKVPIKWFETGNP